MILRNYIANQLYNSTESYFANKSPVHLSNPINFNKLWTHSSYLKALSQEYHQAEGFLTPVEIFKPYYAQSIARYIVDQTVNKKALLDQQGKIHLCEIGGGNGTCMRGILDYLQDHHGDLYGRINCTMIDVSTAFLDKQKQSLLNHSPKVQFINRSVFDYHEVNSSAGFVLGMELLDNLPHDKLIMKSSGLIHEAWVAHEAGKTVEKHKKLSEPLIIEYLELLCQYYKLSPSFLSSNYTISASNVLWHYLNRPVHSSTNSLAGRITHLLSKLHFYNLFKNAGVPLHYNICYIPTGSYLLLKHLKQYFPHHNLILADFSSLQDTLPGTNAPLIQKVVGSERIDKTSYLDLEGNYDVFFPTDFTNLVVLFECVYGVRVLSQVVGQSRSGPTSSFVCSSKEFMRKYADLKATRTRLGYNPLLSDYANSSFFLTS